jgi:hypothetical protein
MSTTKTVALARRGWRQWKPAEARTALTRWKKSGLPAATFARVLGVSSNRLRWWKRQLGEWDSATATATPRLVPAVVSWASSGGAPVAVVQVPGGASIEVCDAGAVPAQWVVEVARGLAGA